MTISICAAVLFLAMLPSGLNLPTSDPAETLEYAPVPPDDEALPDRTGNLAAVGLGGSGIGSTGAPASGGGAADDGLVEYRGTGKNPSTKRCVGTPPRQTDDPLSPPCVAYFAGDNGGSTAGGVSRDEVRILVYRSGGTWLTTRGAEEMPPDGTIIDLLQPPEPDEHTHIRLLRAYTRHFTERYQTYGRVPHVFVHIDSNVTTSEGRRADATEGAARTDPFAVISQARTNADTYVTEIARMNRLVFLGTGFLADQPDSLYEAHPGRIWSYLPSIERRADLAADYLCRKLAPYPVSYTGNMEHQGSKRVFGLVRSANQNRPDRVAYGVALVARLQQCGVHIVEEAHVDADDPASGAPGDMARFRQSGVTTVIWADTFDEGVRSKAAAALGYRPEWLVAMSGSEMDAFLGNRAQDQTVWRHARAITLHLRADVPTDRTCYTAAREADPGIPTDDVVNYGCDFYLDLRQLFTGIQVAGPRLTIPNVDRGFHAIPAVASTDPRVPACYYEPGDYTCVKDGQAQWWDPTAIAPNGKPGCMRMMEEGRRYRIGAWPSGDVEAQRSDSDPCNLQGRGTS